jgi:hypothetical protein
MDSHLHQSSCYLLVIVRAHGSRSYRSIRTEASPTMTHFLLSYDLMACSVDHLSVDSEQYILD